MEIWRTGALPLVLLFNYIYIYILYEDEKECINKETEKQCKKCY